MRRVVCGLGYEQKGNMDTAVFIFFYFAFLFCCLYLTKVWASCDKRVGHSARQTLYSLAIAFQKRDQ